MNSVLALILCCATCTTAGYIAKANATVREFGNHWCPPPWFSVPVKHNGTLNCFMVVSDTWITWVEAERYCGQNSYFGDAHLASIESHDEMIAVASHLLRASQISYWLGGSVNMTSDSGEWAWIDGTPFEYTHWMTDPPQPDNQGGVEHCLEMFGKCMYDFCANYYSQWNDRACYERRPFVCKMVFKPDPIGELDDHPRTSNHRRIEMK